MSSIKNLSKPLGHLVSTRRRKLAAVTLSLALLVGAAPVAMAAQQDTRPALLVALGDSFTSGTGNTPSGEGSKACRRSNLAYPVVAAQAKHIRVRNLACSGATTDDIWSPYNGEASQMKTLRALALKNNVKYVSLTIGGNDVHAYVAFKNSLIGKRNDKFNSEVAALSPKIAETVRWIRWLAPNAEIYVSGYPNMLPATQDEVAGCVGEFLSSFSKPAEWTEMMNALNSAVKAGAQQGHDSHVHYVAPPSFAGHDVCSDQPWGYGFFNSSAGGEGSLHPNQIGHQKMARSLSLSMTKK